VFKPDSDRPGYQAKVILLLDKVQKGPGAHRRPGSASKSRRFMEFENLRIRF
jgi:hypothetical protein